MQLRPSRRCLNHVRPQLMCHYGPLSTLFVVLGWSSVRISAQSTSSVEMASTTPTPPPSSFSTSTTISSSILTSSTDLPTNNTSSTTTTSTSTSSTRLPFPLPLPPGRSSPPSVREQREDSLVNIYFLLLGLGIIFVILGWWCFRRRKKEKRARSQDRGRNALARDLEGWVGQQRRWMYGGWRGTLNSGGNERDAERFRTRHDGGDDNGGREEGFNERGEAPPPYKPPERERIRTSTSSRTAGGGGGGGGGADNANQENPPIPLTDLPPSTSRPQYPPSLHITNDHHHNPSSSPPRYETLCPRPS